MIQDEMIARINTLMDANYSDEMLSAYIAQAQEECVKWEYQLVDEPEPENLDLTRYDTIVIFAVIFGLSVQGAEGETQHSENGILRGFKYSDMCDYIHNNLTPYSRII